jgi:hypothetical protein
MELVHFDGNVTVGYFDHFVAGDATAIASETAEWLVSDGSAHRAGNCPGPQKCKAAKNGNAAAAEAPAPEPEAAATSTETTETNTENGQE